MPAHFHVFDTAWGFCAIAWSARGVTRFILPEATAEAAERALRRRHRDAEPAAATPAIADTIAAVRRYFAGTRTDFSSVALDLEDADGMPAKILAAARAIGWGETTTYGALAKRFGEGWELARDVGQAMAKNPVPLIVPCHRVLGAGGRMGGFSAPGGVATKTKMLALEGHAATKVPAQTSLEF